jgi:hypothetical protein
MRRDASHRSVLASVNPSTYQPTYASAFRLLRPFRVKGASRCAWGGAGKNDALFDRSVEEYGKKWERVFESYWPKYQPMPCRSKKLVISVSELA